MTLRFQKAADTLPAALSISERYCTARRRLVVSRPLPERDCA
jgi:hypothetical protein